MEFKGTKGQWFIDYSEQYMNGSNVLCTPISTNQDINLCDVYGDDDTAKANTLLISKAPEMLEKLSEIVNILDIKCTDGCVNKTWGDFQNGNGEDVGLEIDKFIKDTKKLIKEATEL